MIYFILSFILGLFIATHSIFGMNDEECDTMQHFIYLIFAVAIVSVSLIGLCNI